MRRTIARILLTATVCTVGCADTKTPEGTVETGKGSRPTASDRLTDLTNLNQLREKFDKDSGEIRIILIVSPTCSMCFRGAGWVQKKILEAYPDSRIRVYAVWLPMTKTDARTEWKKWRMPDSKVTHFWDEKKLLGEQFAKYVEPKSAWLIRTKSKVEWDAIYLYGREAVWRETENVPSPLIVWGRPILNVRKNVMKKILPLLETKKQ